MENNRVWIYCRVARPDGFALEAQAQELKRYAAHYCYTVVGTSMEYGSGLTLDRPGLSEVTQAVNEGKVDMVLIKSICRIGRDQVLVRRYIDFLTNRDVTLITLRERMRISYYDDLLASWH